MSDVVPCTIFDNSRHELQLRSREEWGYDRTDCLPFLTLKDQIIIQSMYMLPFACMYMRTGSYVFPCHSKAEIMKKYKINFEDLNDISRPKFNFLSNGALCFPVSLVL